MSPSLASFGHAMRLPPSPASIPPILGPTSYPRLPSRRCFVRHLRCFKPRCPVTRCRWPLPSPLRAAVLPPAPVLQSTVRAPIGRRLPSATSRVALRCVSATGQRTPANPRARVAALPPTRIVCASIRPRTHAPSGNRARARSAVAEAEPGATLDRSIGVRIDRSSRRGALAHISAMLLVAQLACGLLLLAAWRRSPNASSLFARRPFAGCRPRSSRRSTAASSSPTTRSRPRATRAVRRAAARPRTRGRANRHDRASMLRAGRVAP